MVQDNPAMLTWKAVKDMENHAREQDTFLAQLGDKLRRAESRSRVHTLYDVDEDWPPDDVPKVDAGQRKTTVEEVEEEVVVTS